MHKPKPNRQFLFYSILIVILTTLFVGLILPRLSSPTAKPEYTIGLAEGTVRAEVIEILEEGEITLGETTQTYRILRVQVLEGE